MLTDTSCNMCRRVKNTFAFMVWEVTLDFIRSYVLLKALIKLKIWLHFTNNSSVNDTYSNYKKKFNGQKCGLR